MIVKSVDPEPRAKMSIVRFSGVYGEIGRRLRVESGAVAVLPWTETPISPEDGAVVPMVVTEGMVLELGSCLRLSSALWYCVYPQGIIEKPTYQLLYPK